MIKMKVDKKLQDSIARVIQSKLLKHSEKLILFKKYDKELEKRLKDDGVDKK